MKKTFDCVEMKRKVSIRIHEELKDLSLQEKIEYWRKRNEIFQQEQEKIREAKSIK